MRGATLAAATEILARTVTGRILWCLYDGIREGCLVLMFRERRHGRRAFLGAACAGMVVALAPGLASAAAAPTWVAPIAPLRLLRDPREGVPLADLSVFTPLRVVGPARGDFYPVEEPYARARGWVDGRIVGPIGDPDRVSTDRWWGEVVVEDGTLAYREPMEYGRPVAWYEAGTRLAVRRWVEGEQVWWGDALWAEIAEGVYVYGRTLRQRLSREPVAPIRAPSGAWIAINRTLQTIAAFEGRDLRFWSRTSTGRPGWETPLGAFRINRRVAQQTMDSRTLGPDAARANYRIENVRFVQYFDYEGNALHENYWVERDLFGLPFSHGCAGLTATDAARFWEFGDLGMPVIVHL